MKHWVITTLITIVSVLGSPLLYRQFVTNRVTDRGGMENPQAFVEPAPGPLQVLKLRQYDSEDEWEDGSTLLCSVEWDDIILGEKSATEFSNLNEQLQKRNVDNKKLGETILNEMLPAAKETAAKQQEFYGYTSSSQYFIQRADDRILSILMKEERGANHEYQNYRILGINLNPVTGQELKLTDVLNDTTKLPAILNDKIKGKYTLKVADGLSKELAEHAEDDFTWTLDYQGITFYFASDEPAFKDTESLTVTIWFDESPELFKVKYTSAPDGGWARMLPLSYEVEADLDSKDGVGDRLYLSVLENEYNFSDLYVTKNGKKQHLKECYGFEMNPFLVCPGGPDNERYFLYVEATAENGYTTIYVYDLNEEDITLNGQVSGAGFAGVLCGGEEEYGAWYEEVFNDPSEFVLSSRLQILGTFTGSRTYTGNPTDGTIQPETEYYELAPDVAAIVSAIDLEVIMLPQQVRETLPAGTEFYFRRTDGESYAELELADGRQCRIDIGYRGWTPLVNGIPEWDCFENLMYAD